MLKLYAPGTRKGNKHYVAKGRVNGQHVEINTRSEHEGSARRVAEDFERRVGKRRPVDQVTTFGQAADGYIQFRSPSKYDRKRIAKLKKRLGDRPVAAIVQNDLVEAASVLCPKAKPSSKNRNVITPASSVLHYAAENGWCEWKRIKRFKEAAPVTRAVSRQDATKLIRKAKGKQKLLLTFLFVQGTRITDTLKLTWDDVDLKTQTVRVHVAKTDTYRVFPLAREAFLALANEAEKAGRLFPWRTRWGVYRALKTLLSETALKFTPHMARHSLGTWLNESGAGLKTIMGALGHADAKSSIRYQDADIEIVRAAQVKMWGGVGRKSGSLKLLKKTR